ncbi:Hypothetical protein A7982_01931 [Minicystis rosea]|nr:Hypothetical protein A7982_01931 [Minicystis rosea]
MSSIAASEALAIRALYERILVAWNARDATAMAAPFTDDGNIVGFDGSQVDTRAGIEAHLAPIFASHRTPVYVAKVREVRMLAPGAALLRAVAGMVPDGAEDLNPALATIHTLAAVHNDDGWRAALFQSTPAAWHGRPNDLAALVDELREVQRTGRICI